MFFSLCSFCCVCLIIFFGMFVRVVIVRLQFLFVVLFCMLCIKVMVLLCFSVLRCMLVMFFIFFGNWVSLKQWVVNNVNVLILFVRFFVYVYVSDRLLQVDVLCSILFINIRLYLVVLCKILVVLVIFIIKVECLDVRLFVVFTWVKM